MPNHHLDIWWPIYWNFYASVSLEGLMKASVICQWYINSDFSTSKNFVEDGAYMKQIPRNSGKNCWVTDVRITTLNQHLLWYGVSPIRCQNYSICANASSAPLRKHLGEIYNNTPQFKWKEMDFKMSVKLRSFCLGLNILMIINNHEEHSRQSKSITLITPIRCS